MPVLSQAAFETRAGAAYVLDYNTGAVLMEKNAETPLPPASMSKLMTLNMLFEALEDGRVDMDTRFRVSTRAKNMGGSTMFLNERDRPTVKQLIQGIIVLSGNDACVVVAEGLAGSEDAFARSMTARAKELGMTDSTFANASGWPDPNQRMSMRDLGVLANRLIKHFPEYYSFFGLKEFPFDGRAPDNRFNRNPLLSLGIGADGLKTGHTSEAGYGLVGSAVQGNRRIVFVISGLNSETERAEEAERIVSWAFRQFVEKTVMKKGSRLAQAPVWMGEAAQVGLIADQDLTLLVPASSQDEIKATIEYTGPIAAPIAKGDKVAELVISVPGQPDVRHPALAEADVAPGGFVKRMQTAAEVLLRGIAGEAAALY
ncbi:D-alanyl-D-alanine carboxypeptidase family protein [Brevirhabdus sp.]|uniref:D-alanyl-D-alanine carboxypeptidase family protein n=1 Tax=Brevirhabdus sp. TaxID=2004514 RepID=UPI0040588CB8